MSWAKDEWKQDLPPKALQKITDLENENENLQKLRNQQELKIDSYVTALEKGKVVLEEERSSNAALQKEVQELTLKVSTLEARQEKYVNEIKNKEKTVEFGEELLDKARQKLKAENAKSMELQKSLDKMREEAENYTERSEKMIMEMVKLKQEKAHISKENENITERLTALTKEIQTLRNTVSQNEQRAIDIEQESEKDNDESLQETVVWEGRSDTFLDILKKENTSLLREVEQLRQQREQMKNIVEEKTKEVERNVVKLADIRVELQTTKKELKDSNGEVTKLERTLESREREMTSLREKLVRYKTNKERMNEEMKSLNDQLKIQNQREVLPTERSDSVMKRQDLKEELSNATYDAEDASDGQKGAECSKIKQLFQENENLLEHVRWLRVTNSALMDNLKDKEQRLQTFYEEQQERHKKEETRLENIESLLLENEELKQRVQELENEAKLSAKEQLCTSCKQNINSNEIPKYKIPAVDKNDVCATPKRAKEMVNMAAQCTEVDVAMSESMEVDVPEKSEELQVIDKSLQTDNVLDVTETTKQVTCAAIPNKPMHGSDYVISGTTSEPDSNLQHKILQVLICLSTVQIEHEMVQRGLNKCYNTINTIKENMTTQATDAEKQQETMISKLLSDILCLASQLKAVRGIGQRCAACVKSQAESIAGCLERIRKEKSTTVQNEKTHNDTEDGQVNEKKDGRSPERDLSWDDFESEQAFQRFKSRVDPLIKQIEDLKEYEDFVAKGYESTKTVRKNMKEIRQENHVEERSNQDSSDLDSTKKEGKPDGAENVLEMDLLVEVLSEQIDENNDLLVEKMTSLFQHFENKIIKNISDKEKKRQQNKQASIKKTTATAEKSENEEENSSDNSRNLREGNFILGELEIIKRKISAIQKPMKHLVLSVETSKQEKEKAHSHIDLLTTQMRNISSHHEMRYTELQNTLKTQSERELSLQRQIDNLKTEKEDLNCNYEESFGNLKKKELDLVKLSQELKSTEAKNKENERRLKNKIEVLQGEKACIWHDYMEASKEAQDRKKELESFVEKMKMTEHSLLSLFNAIGNIDDFLQRAKEMNLFQ